MEIHVPLSESPVWHIIYFFACNPKFSSESRSESTSASDPSLSDGKSLSPVIDANILTDLLYIPDIFDYFFPV